MVEPSLKISLLEAFYIIQCSDTHGLNLFLISSLVSPLIRITGQIPQKVSRKWINAFTNLSHIIFRFTLTCLSCPLKSTDTQCVVVCLRRYAEVIVVRKGGEIVVGGLHVDPQLVDIVHTEKMVQVLVAQPMLASQLSKASMVVSPVTIEVYRSIHSSLEYLHTAIRNVL